MRMSLPDFAWISAGAAEKSKSGPMASGHTGLPGFFSLQPIAHTSLGSNWFTHFTAPVARSIATIALVIFCGGSA